MFKYILKALLNLGLGLTTSLYANVPEFEGYLESWNHNSLQTIEHLNINSQTIVDIAFGNLTFTEEGSTITKIGGLEMSLDDFRNFIGDIHSKGGKVKLSLGGATYPLCQYVRTQADAVNVAQCLAKVVSQFNLDGIDLDIEDTTNNPYYYPGFPQIAIFMIEEIRNLLPSTSIITLTVPGGAWFEPWQTIIPGAKNSVNFVTFMEYNIWIDPSRTFVQQIEWDIAYYQQLWGLTPQKMQLGLMPGKDDLHQNLTLNDAEVLTQFAKAQGLSGVMIWSFNRDYEGQDGQGSGAYGRAIQSILGQ